MTQFSEPGNQPIGQANYLTNHIVRTPYETEINVQEEIPKLDFEVEEEIETGFKEEIEMLF